MSLNRQSASKILGVNPNASKEDIKKAYRKLSMKHHPDREGGDEEQFKKLQEAYDFLENGPKPGAIPDDMEQAMREAMHSHFNFKHPGQRPDVNSSRQSGRGMQMTVDITIEQAFYGCVLQLKIPQLPNTISVAIPPGVTEEMCVHNETINDLTVRIFARIKSEWTITFPSIFYGGDSGKDGDASKDLFVSPLRMILGGWEEVSVIGGDRVSIRIPPGLEANKLLKVKDKGYWKNHSQNIRGNCYFRVIPAIKKLTEMDPTELTEFQTAIADLNSGSR